jgi:hypothetical protein
MTDKQAPTAADDKSAANGAPADLPAAPQPAPVERAHEDLHETIRQLADEAGKLLSDALGLEQDMTDLKDKINAKLREIL